MIFAQSWQEADLRVLLSQALAADEWEDTGQGVGEGVRETGVGTAENRIVRAVYFRDEKGRNYRNVTHGDTLS